MDRRSFLQASSPIGATLIAGCSFLPGSTDSDNDGVPDSEDYAPNDADVQQKQDVIDQFLVRSTPSTPESSPELLSEVQSETNREYEANISTLSLQNSTNEITATITPKDQPDYSFRLLAVTREYPYGDIIDYTITDTFDGSGESITYTFPLSNLDSSRVFTTVYTTSGTDIDNIPPESLRYIRETDPYILKDSELQISVSEELLQDLEQDSFSRTRVTGGYHITLEGQTRGEYWKTSYLISRASYLWARGASRGRTRSGHLKYTLARNFASNFAELLQTEAQQNGFQNTDEQVEFLVNVVQSYPYVSDKINTGFDDYSKFPQETLADISGDCEDSTILLSALLHEWGYDIALMEFPQHIGVGIKGRFSGDYLTAEGSRYYYTETTSPGWGIGEIPTALNPEEVSFTLFPASR